MVPYFNWYKIAKVLACCVELKLQRKTTYSCEVLKDAASGSICDNFLDWIKDQPKGWDSLPDSVKDFCAKTELSSQ